MKKTRILMAISLLLLCLSFAACNGGEKTAVVAFPNDSSSGYNWDQPQFDAEYFQLTSQRTYTETAPGLPSTQYREWTLTPLKAGSAQIVFTQYDSQEDLDAKTDPFKRVTVTYEISEDLTLKETNRVEVNYKD